MVFQSGSVVITIIRETADLTVLQKTITYTIHKKKASKGIVNAKEVGCSQSARYWYFWKCGDEGMWPFQLMALIYLFVVALTDSHCYTLVCDSGEPPVGDAPQQDVPAEGLPESKL